MSNYLDLDAQITRREMLNKVAVGTTALATGAAVRGYAEYLVGQARHKEAKTELGNQLDWLTAAHNFEAGIGLTFMQPSIAPDGLRNQLDQNSIIAVPHKDVLNPGGEGFVFAFTSYHEKNLGPLSIRPENERYITHTTHGLRIIHAVDGLKKIDRIDDTIAHSYSIVSPSIQNTTFSYYDTEFDDSGKQQLKLKHTVLPWFHQDRLDQARLDVTTGQVQWRDPKNQTAWDALEGGDMTALGIDLSASPLSFLGIFGGMELPKEASLKQRVTLAMYQHPPFFQTEEGKLFAQALMSWSPNSDGAIFKDILKNKIISPLIATQV